jgi:uncharacterized membrane protein (UPF0136 family)
MARTVVLIYGILVLLGGVAGYQIRGSTVSLIAGGGVGTALLVCYALAAKKPAMAFRTAGMLTLVMLGFWSFRTYTLMNEGKSIMMSAGNIVLAAVVLGLLAYAHFSAVKQKSASEG